MEVSGGNGERLRRAVKAVEVTLAEAMDRRPNECTYQPIPANTDQYRPIPTNTDYQYRLPIPTICVG
jgi:hypothetical protein